MFERYLKKLKGYLCNQNHLKGWIVEQYIDDKVIKFCLEYISNLFPIDNPKHKLYLDKELLNVGVPMNGEQLHLVDCAHLA